MFDNQKRLQEDALSAAVAGDWESAIHKNTELVELNNRDISAYLRLGFAYLQQNKLKEAKKAYQKALEIQPVNQIARSNLDKINILGDEPVSTEQSTMQIDPNLFLNVIGKTKVIELLNIGQLPVLARLKVGQEVDFKVKKRRIEIRDKKDNYLGVFPDDISKRLIYFMEEGSEYAIYIKEASKNSVLIFIKEIKKGKNVQKYTSFPKNIQDDLKLMHQDEDSEDHDKEHDEEDLEDLSKEAPVDIEALAEESQPSDYYSDVDVSFDEDRDEEFEE
ncbi:MAG TPA: tetratricopeptide repeat protein [Candidatus Nitrosocosmicus sp.]|nr:tetratricopeptide repeat protein [Candidatus Nitrosocosmicus sp.]